MTNTAARSKTAAARLLNEVAIYPGVRAEVVRVYDISNDISVCGVRFSGFEKDLRAAGLVRDGDRLPKRFRGDSGFATMCRDGRLKLRSYDSHETALRDNRFQRFMRSAGLGDNDE